jgi:hypothetical protein
MWVFIIFSFLLLGSTEFRLTCPTPWNLSVLTWNVNGAAKLRGYFPELRYLRSFDAILLQETFTVDVHASLDLDGYITFNVPARPTGGRPSWGLTSFFRITSFVGGHLRTVHSPCEWIQVCLS